MKLLKTLFLLVSLTLIKNESAKAYYFQLADLKDSIVYKFECKEDPSETQYWKLTANNNTLITEAYTNDLEKFEFFVEEYTDVGTEVTKYISYYKNKSGEIDVIDRRIKDKDVYKWSTEKDYGYSAEFIDKNYGSIASSVYRTFEKETVISVLGTNHNVLKFKCIYRTQIPEENYDYKYTQYMYYAKGIGLVKIEKEYPEGKNATLDLTKIISKTDWDNMLK